MQNWEIMWANGADPGRDLKSVVLPEQEATTGNYKKKKKEGFFLPSTMNFVWNLLCEFSTLGIVMLFSWFE